MSDLEQLVELLIRKAPHSGTWSAWNDYRALLLDQIRAYGDERAREERERCIKALCSYCRKDIPLENGYHQIRDGLVPLGADYRVKMCPAYALHKLD